MRVFTVGVIPLFLTESGISGAGPAQIKFFDAYYVNPPVVGFHVVGS